MSSPSPYLGRGGRAYGLLEVEIAAKSTTSFSSTITNSSSSSPSSTLSESSPLAISTRKPRSSTRRKRPNQTYNEAAALLSTAYPKIFSLPTATTTPLPNHSFPLDSSDLLLPLRALDSATRFLPIREKDELEEPKLAAAEVSSRWQNSSAGNWKDKAEEDDFDAESMLDEEFEQVGIDSIMGGTAITNYNEELVINHNLLNHHHHHQETSFVYGYPPGFHNQYWVGGNGNNNSNNRAFRRSVDDWWNYPVVDVLQISPRLHSIPTNQMNLAGGAIDEKVKQSATTTTTTSSGEKINKNGNKQNSTKKLKMKKVAKLGGDMKETEEDCKVGRKDGGGGLLLKLNYDEVLKEWSGKGSPFPEELAGGGFLEQGSDASAIAAQIDLFSSDGNGGGGGVKEVREASVLRYKEKRLSRLFSKKIRYQVRKVNADQRPRMKGRFVRRSSSSRNSRSRSNIKHKDGEL